MSKNSGSYRPSVSLTFHLPDNLHFLLSAYCPSEPADERSALVPVSEIQLSNRMELVQEWLERSSAPPDPQPAPIRTASRRYSHLLRPQLHAPPSKYPAFHLIHTLKCSGQVEGGRRARGVRSRGAYERRIPGDFLPYSLPFLDDSTTCSKVLCGNSSTPRESPPEQHEGLIRRIAIPRTQKRNTPPVSASSCVRCIRAAAHIPGALEAHPLSCRAGPYLILRPLRTPPSTRITSRIRSEHQRSFCPK